MDGSLEIANHLLSSFEELVKVVDSELRTVPVLPDDREAVACHVDVKLHHGLAARVIVVQDDDRILLVILIQVSGTDRAAVHLGVLLGESFQFFEKNIPEPQPLGILGGRFLTGLFSRLSFTLMPVTIPEKHVGHLPLFKI